MFAPRWPSSVKIVVLCTLASRAVQATGRPEPRDMEIVRALIESFGFRADEIVADLLVGCGLALDPTPDETAACSARFVEQDRAGARPDLIVLVGETTRWLAEEAQLVVGRESLVWNPVGASRSVPVLSANTLEDVVLGVSKALGRQVRARAPANRSSLLVHAASLRDLLGEHFGARVLEQGADWRSGRWTDPKKSRFDLSEVRDHLLGHRTWAPFLPRGPWNYAVLDLDRHGALQASNFAETCKHVQRAFPNSMFVRSSDSGGIHVYVPLPAKVRYQEASAVLRAFVTIRGMRWGEAGPKHRKVRAELVEVPASPPRLPFGSGSHVIGSKEPLGAQLAGFVSFIRNTPPTDYLRARREVSAEFRLPHKRTRSGWSVERTRLVTEQTDAKETEHLPAPVFDQGDPWIAVHALPRRRGRVLTEPLLKIAAFGIPAYSTRRYWTETLIKHLADLVTPAQVKELMAHWLRNRDHVSVDVENDIDLVEQQLEKAIERHYRELRGVPERVWRVVRADIGSNLGRLRTRPVFGRLKRIAHPGDLDREEAEWTAFFILRRFYAKGTRIRTVNRRTEFGRFAGKDAAHDLEILLTTESRWIEMDATGIPGVTSSSYELGGEAWPPRPSEPRLFVPT